MPPRRIGEFDLIRRLQRAMPVDPAAARTILAGIGDDAAVLRLPREHLLLATTDLLVEGIHFELAYTTSYQLGYKAAVTNLSDIAAMGGIPLYVLIAIAVPPRTPPREVERVYAGITAACRPAGATIIGGDTSVSPRDWFLALTVLGEAGRTEVLRRSGARPGDHVYVTGTLGDARAGLEVLRRRRPPDADKTFAHLIARHRMPTPRLPEARCLAQGRLASAAIDLSDGLAGDIRHLCENSAVGVLLDLRRLPLSPSLSAYARSRRRNPVEYALSGGEDYELLFTVPPAKVKRVEALIQHGRLGATAIGTMTLPREGLRTIGLDGRISPLTARGYEHGRSAAGGRRA